MNKIQKIIAIGTAVTTIAWMSGVAFLAPVASAATAEEIQASIDALMAELAKLQDQLAELEGTPAATYEGIPADFAEFTEFMKRGSKSDEVKYMQIILQTEVGEDVVGTADGIFGKMTDAAVKQFQTDNSLVSDGLVGAKTRAVLNEKLAAGVTPPVVELTVSSVSPASDAVNVAVDSNVIVALSMALDADTVTTDSAKITGVDSAVSVSDKTITINPSADLAENTTYTVTLTTAIKATDGTALKAEYTSSFSTGETVTLPPAEGLSISLASDTPVAAIVPLASLGVPYTKIKVVGTGNISQIVVKRTGLGHKDDFAGVAIYEGNVKLTLSRTITSDETVTFNFSTPLEISGTKYLTIAGDIATATGGNVAAGDVDVLEVTSITADGTVTGTFPIKGNSMSLGAVSVGQLDADNDQATSDTDINVGEQNQEVARFRITAQTTAGASSSEDILVKAIRFKQFGSSDLDDLSNFKLYDNTTEMTDITVSTSGDYVTFDNLDMTITKGNYKRLVLKADIISGGGQTVRFQIEEPSDLTTEGKTYNYGVFVHDGDTSWTESELYGTSISIAAGELSFAITGPAAQTVTRKTDDIVAADMTITAADDTLVTKMYGIFDGTENDSTNGTIEASIEGVQLIETSTGTTYDAVDDAEDATDNYQFYFSNIDVPAGTSTWQIIWDTVDASTDNTDTYQVYINANTSEATNVVGTDDLPAMTAKNSQGKAIAAGDIKPASAISGNLITLGGASLTVSEIALDNTNVVGSADGIVALKLQITAGSADDATITQMVFEDVTGTTTADGSTEMSDFTLEQVYPTTTVLQSAVSPSAATEDFTVTFNQINSGSGLVVPAGTYVQVQVKFDTNSPSAITDGHIMALQSQADGITANNSIGDDLADGDINDDSAIVGHNITLNDDGQLTITKEDVLTDQQVVGGTTGVDTLKLKFKADYEGINITSLVLDDATDGNGDSISAVHLYDEAGALITTAAYAESTATATFGDAVSTMFTVAKDEEKIITVKTDFKAVGLNEHTGDSNDAVVWTLDHDSTSAVTATGASSNAAISLAAVYADSEILVGGDADITSDTFLVRRAMISSLAGANSYTSQGTLLASGTTNFKVFAFTVSAAADSSGNNYDDAVDLRGLKLTVAAAGDLASSALSSVVIYRADVSGTTIAADTATTTYLQWDDDSLANLKNIKPGESATFVVKATIPSGTYTAADTLQVSMADLGDATSTTITTFADGRLIWADRDGTAGADCDWVGYSGIDITDVQGPSFIGPQQ